MLRVPGQHPTLDCLCISGLDRFREVAQVGARLVYQVAAAGRTVARMDRGHTTANERFELAETL
jgi:hypothetical protein